MSTQAHAATGTATAEPPKASTSNGFKIPGGPEKDKPIGEASDGTVAYWAKRIGESLDAGTSRSVERDKALLAALQAEGKKRAGSAGERKQAAQVALAKVEREVVGTVRDAGAATAKLQQAQAFGHLVSPATDVGQLPEGCTIALSAVLVDIENETYKLPGGKQGLGKPALDKIAGAAGVSWDPNHTRRMDNGRDPHYVHFKAVGTVRLFDGMVRVITGEVEVDARAGSPQIDEIRTKAEKRAAERPNEPNDGGASQILELRKFILRHAESKAKLRAIRSLGVRTSYSANDLAKPFIVARVMFTGQTEDPMMRQMFGQMIAASFLGGSQALYGAPVQVIQAPQPIAATALPAQASRPALAGEVLQTAAGHEPPPVGSTTQDPDDDDSPEPGSGDPDAQGSLY